MGRVCLRKRLFGFSATPVDGGDTDDGPVDPLPPADDPEDPDILLTLDDRTGQLTLRS